MLNKSDLTPVHFFWIGGHMPETISTNFKAWQSVENIVLHLWNDDNISDLIDTKLLDLEAWPKAMIVDLLRVKALLKYGGLYVDADIFPHLKFVPSLSGCILLADNSRTLTNGFIYSDKDHAYLEILLREVEMGMQDYLSAKKSNVAQATGPGAVTRALYIMAFRHGVDSIKKDMSIFKWKRIRFSNASKSTNMRRNCFLKKSWGTHLALRSWVIAFENPPSKIREFTYQLRKTNLAFILDFLRLLIKSPKSPPYSIWKLRLLANMDISEFEREKDWSGHIFRCENLVQIESAIRNLRCGVINVSTGVKSDLVKCGWLNDSEGLYYRRRPSKLIENRI